MKLAIRSPRASELVKLKAEIAALRSFMIGMAGRDPEGNYRPDFVRRIQRAAQDTETLQFQGADHFLEVLRDTD